MEEHRTKQVLDFLLSSYRAKLAILNPTENCPFDFQQFLSTWKGKYPDWGTLKATMKRDLEPLMEQGIFDSIIPYLSSSINQSGARHDELMRSTKDNYLVGADCGNNGLISTEIVALSPPTTKSSSKTRLSTSREVHVQQIAEEENSTEIVIHVCDEAKNLRQDFKCIQSVLLQEMGYFSKVTVRGQKLKDMDISVHCDISVFDWLMKWVKSKMDLGTEYCNTTVSPKLEPSNVIGLMVSAEFLQMPSLTSECIQFTANHIEDVILTSPNLGCLNESLTNRLSTYFDNNKMEIKIVRIDKNDRITSRLYTQFTMSLNDPPDAISGEGVQRGHFASTATLFRCISCGRLVTNDVASKVPCTTMRLDCRGRLYSIHVKDTNWSLSNFIRELKRELKTWRRVYWRLWGTVHFLSCTSCQLTFPVKNFSSCRFHPKLPQLQVSVVASTGEIQERNFDLDDDIDDPDEPHANCGTFSNVVNKLSIKDEEVCINPFRRQREKLIKAVAEKKGRNTDNLDPDLEKINCAFGVYPCCRKPGYKFYPLPNTNGCQFRDHTVSPTSSPHSNQILQRLSTFKELIVSSPTTKDRGEMKKGTFSTFEWGGIIDLTPPKPVTSSSTATSSLFLGQKYHHHTKFQGQTLTRSSKSQPKINLDSSTTSTDVDADADADDSNNNSTSWSDTEEPNGGVSGRGHVSWAGSGSNIRGAASQTLSEFWSWNSDFTTRYNQDMQREKEEKLMTDLELLLSQRVSLTQPSAASSIRFGYLGRRTHKNLGGSFIKLEEKLREDQSRGRSSVGGGGFGGGNIKALTSNQRSALTKSAKP